MTAPKVKFPARMLHASHFFGPGPLQALVSAKPCATFPGPPRARWVSNSHSMEVSSNTMSLVRRRRASSSHMLAREGMRLPFAAVPGRSQPKGSDGTLKRCSGGAKHLTHLRCADGAPGIRFSAFRLASHGSVAQPKALAPRTASG